MLFGEESDKRGHSKKLDSVGKDEAQKGFPLAYQ